MNVCVTRLLRDEGTVVVFEAIAEDGGRVEFAADHRPAQELVRMLTDYPDGDVRAYVEPLQVLRHERTLTDWRATEGGDYYAPGPRR